MNLLPLPLLAGSPCRARPFAYIRGASLCARCSSIARPAYAPCTWLRPSRASGYPAAPLCPLALVACLRLSPGSFDALRPAPFSHSLVLCSLVDATRHTPHFPHRTDVQFFPRPYPTETKFTETKIPIRNRQTDITPDLYIVSRRAALSYPCHTPLSFVPALQAVSCPLAETVKNAPSRLSPYDSTFTPLQLATSSTTRLRACEHAIATLKPLFFARTVRNRFIRHYDLLLMPVPFPIPLVCSWSPLCSHLHPGSALFPWSPLPLLLLLESPFVSYPQRSGVSPFPYGVPKGAFYLDPESRLERTRGGSLVAVCIMPEPPLVDQFVLKGVKVEMQADCTTGQSALAFVPLRTTVRVIRGPQNTYPLKNAPIPADPLGKATSSEDCPTEGKTGYHVLRSSGRFCSCLDEYTRINGSEVIPVPGCSFLSGYCALLGLCLVALRYTRPPICTQRGARKYAQRRGQKMIFPYCVLPARRSVRRASK